MKRFSNRELYEIVLREARRLEIPKTIIHSKPKHKVRHYSEDIAKKCLLDRDRTLTWMDSISATTPEGGTGIDLGAGTGILGFAFLNAGGGYLTAVEKSPYWAVFAKYMMHRLGFADRMEVVNEDARTFVPGKMLDYVICELVDSGLMEEPLVPVIQHVRQFTSPNAVFIPERAVSRLAVYGQHNGKNPDRLTRTVQYDDFDLRTDSATGIDNTIELEIVKDGRPSIVIVKTDLAYPNGIVTRQEFPSVCVPRPVNFVLEAPSRSLGEYISDVLHRLPPVAYRGQKISLAVKYAYGGTANFRGRLK